MSHFSLKPDGHKYAGTAIPVFSIRTEDSFGVGDFHDLKKMADWAAATGQHVLQLLPINDTTMTRTWMDSYPYNANSSFALHPQFLYLPALGVKETPAYKKDKAALEALPQVDYEKVNELKLAYALKAYKASGAEVLASKEFAKFAKDNAYWLEPYAAYCVLRDVYGTADFAGWGPFAKYSKKKVQAFVAEHRADYDFYRYVQFQLDVQLKDAVAYAHGKEVAFKGDLPIGVSRTSCDAWTSPKLFHMDMQAGAPPDAFAADGQNWGFPTYNWEEMAKDGYLWWRRRLGKMGEYFDAYRIDHILGFFRIWEIPVPHKSGLMGHFSPALPYSAEEIRSWGMNPYDGNLFLEDPRRRGLYHPRIDGKDGDTYNRLHEDYFYHRNDALWKEEAMKKLPALIGASKMLACGEDLGMIPACVPEVMRELGILSLEIQRMPKDTGVLFADPSRYPYMSVCATGTHDMPSLRAWWEEDRGLSARYYWDCLHFEGDPPYFCEPWVCERAVAQHMQSPSMLAILPLQDWIAIDGDVRYNGHPNDERINVPAIPRYYWRYRMHVTVESLLANEGLCARIRGLVASGGR